ncbi:hypothetical protein H0H93_009188 [Arthromyces matolae]|nr:hypothetical protein H0H93_009188 [Arthromyces matolae]
MFLLICRLELICLSVAGQGKYIRTAVKFLGLLPHIPEHPARDDNANRSFAGYPDEAEVLYCVGEIQEQEGGALAGRNVGNDYGPSSSSLSNQTLGLSSVTGYVVGNIIQQPLSYWNSILGAYLACLVIYTEWHVLLVQCEAILSEAGKLDALQFTPNGPAGIFGLYLLPGQTLPRVFLNEFVTDTLIGLILFAAIDPTNALVPPVMSSVVVSLAYAVAIWGFATPGTSLEYGNTLANHRRLQKAAQKARRQSRQSIIELGNAVELQTPKPENKPNIHYAI